MTALQLVPLLRALTAGGGRFIVVGGVAVAAHGPLRTTEDLDVVPSPDPGDLTALGNALVAIDAHLTGAPDVAFGPEHRTALAQGRNLTLTTSLGDVDVLQRLPGVLSFAELDRDALGFEIDGFSVRAASLNHLVAMKRARGSKQDLADIEALERR